MEEGEGTEEEGGYRWAGQEETIQSGSHRYRNISIPEVHTAFKGLQADSVLYFWLVFL